MNGIQNTPKGVPVPYVVLVLLIGVVIGLVAYYIFTRFKLSKAKEEAEKVIADANVKAENIVKEATLDAKTQAYEYKLQEEKEVKKQRLELTKFETQLSQREQSIDRRDIALQGREDALDQKTKQLDKKQAELGKLQDKLKSQINEKVAELEKIAAMSASQAKEELFRQVEVQMENEVTAYIKEAKTKASLYAKDIIADEINRYSQEEVTERTVNVVSLPSEEMKGRIIGREGRNIRAIENATGAELIIDDTPEVITVSCFNPVRREIARLSLEKLIKDGRIQPSRIEEVVEKTKREVEDIMYKAGEDAIFELGLSKMKKEEIMMIGKLKYRTSFGQNVLQHSIEVSWIAAMMAGELGLDVAFAKRAGLLHDIGKVGTKNTAVFGGENDKGKIADLYEDAIFGCELIEQCFNADGIKLKRICQQALKAQMAADLGQESEVRKMVKEAKILQVANKFDEITGMSLTGESLSEVKAVTEFMDNPDIYDPEAVRALIDSIYILFPGVSVELNTGEKALVINENPDNILKPTVISFRRNTIMMFASMRAVPFRLPPRGIYT